MRAWRSSIHFSKLAAVRFSTLEVLKTVRLENLYLLLRLLQPCLAELQEFSAALIRSQRLLERELAGFHAGDDGLEFGQRRLEAERPVGIGLGHGQFARRKLDLEKAFNIAQAGAPGNDVRSTGALPRPLLANITWPATSNAIMNHTTLIQADDLDRNLGNPEWVLFDCRHDLANPEFGIKAYSESHLPGARFANVDRDLSAPLTGRNGRHPLPDAQSFGRWLGEMGVDATKQVVAYDQAAGAYAGRLWWMLRWLGHERVAVLDGGWSAWVAAGHPVTAEVPRPLPARFTPRPRDSWVAANYVASHLDTPRMLLIDARSNDRFHGRNETIDPVAGHIPGARNRFYRDNLDADGRFKSATRLREEFLQILGSSKPGEVVHHCGSGVSACHNLLAMEVAGLGGSRLYPGSWSEWIADRTRPITT
jgi:thiosulfate/3-mercaptopyruvate sulfurtransferase